MFTNEELDRLMRSVQSSININTDYLRWLRPHERDSTEHELRVLKAIRSKLHFLSSERDESNTDSAS
jgi:hypothetical protein